jgi:hypothetical protein
MPYRNQCRNPHCAVTRPHLDHDGYLSTEQVTPAPWTPGPRPPIGQYRITVTVTGDDIGADMHDWLLNRLYDTVGMTACADTIEPLTEAPPDRATTLRLHQDDNARTRTLYAGDREIASTTGYCGLDLFDELTAAIADATGTPLTTCPDQPHSHP